MTAKEHSYSFSIIEGKQRWTMYRLKNGQGYRGLGPQTSPALSFLPKKGINRAPTDPFDLLFQASVISKRGELGSTVLQKS